MPASDLQESLRQAISAIPDVVCGYLFGSRARGDAHPTSDVDVAILFEPPPAATLAGLRFDVAAILEDNLRRPVDLVVLNNAPVDLVHRVLRDGIVVFERDRSARIRFEVNARNGYFDLSFILARYRGTGALHD
ncbi:MAG: type VII toxin-antitoxin system MntA family adenylyltransferase antitoxin [Gammaproteobacteria bacterium]